LTKSLLVLGSTGSIGRQTLDLVRASKGALRVDALVARSSWEEVVRQAEEFRPRIVAMEDEGAADEVRARCPAGTEVLGGAEASLEAIAAAEFDVALHGIVGAAGLRPPLAVLDQRRGGRAPTLGLANKESLVIAGELVVERARSAGATIVPVDSEHSAVHQCLRGESIERVRRVHLTASGGPFRRTPLDELRAATPDAALAHPNWDMGPRVTVGSATLMNKALEVIELHHLFGLSAERIHVVVHPQSIVHSMVEFVDGSVMAQMGPPDMRVPIHHAIHHPDRGASSLEGFSFASFAELTFEEPDRERFPALDLGFRCVKEGGASGAVLNAADEIAVQHFLEGEIGLLDIAEFNERALDARLAHPVHAGAPAALDDYLAADAWARDFARDQAARIRP